MKQKLLDAIKDNLKKSVKNLETAIRKASEITDEDQLKFFFTATQELGIISEQIVESIDTETTKHMLKGDGPKPFKPPTGIC